MLIDAGGLSTTAAFDIGDRVVAPVLRDRGIRRLDAFVLTHGDPDHVGGAPSIVREFRPRQVLEGIPVLRLERLTALRLETEASGARWGSAFRGDRLVRDGIAIAVRHPEPPDWERPRVRNDDSVVLELLWRDASIVLTGDIGEAVEPAIAAALGVARLRVLKVPHHGSRTSSSLPLVRSFRPDVAVVSAGRRNNFGHPTPGVLQRYRDVGAAIFRTDQDGAVTISTDGHSLDVSTFTGRTLSVR
jgi:competence protein ComEC